MLARSPRFFCRAKFVGPHSQFSLTKHGELVNPRQNQQSKYERDMSRLTLQKFVINDPERQREAMYHICRKCGLTTVVFGFERTPSARLGLFGRCRDDLDYTHHAFRRISKSQYEELRDVNRDERLTKVFFDEP